MAVAGLGRSAVAAAVVGDDAIAVAEEDQHLIVPVIGRQWPTMTEHDGLAFAPVLVEDLDAVFGLHDAHGVPAFAAVVVARENRNQRRPSAGWPHRAGPWARDDVISACAKRASRPKRRARNRSRRNRVSDQGAACRPCNPARRQKAYCPRCAAAASRRRRSDWAAPGSATQTCRGARHSGAAVAAPDRAALCPSNTAPACG